jgi:hypothetical protein
MEDGRYAQLSTSDYHAVTLTTQLARYVDSRAFALFTTSRTRQFLPSSTDKGKGKLDPAIEHSSVPDSDFIRLPSRRGHSNTDPQSTYRSINTSKPEYSSSYSDAPSISEDGVSSSESGDEDNVPRTAHQQSLAMIEASLQTNPTSLALWFALVELTLSTLPPSAKTSLIRARADIKLSILDRAMRIDERNRDSVELRVKWLNAGADIWGSDKLEKEWEQAVRELGTRRNDKVKREFIRNDIWNEWFRWRISSAGRASGKPSNLEGIIDDARRVLENVEGEFTKVKTLWRVAVLLQEAGRKMERRYIYYSKSLCSHN